MIELYAILGAIGAAIIGALVAYLKGRGDAKAKARAQNDQTYIKDRKAADHADLGIGASDAERVKRLHQFAEDK